MNGTHLDLCSGIGGFALAARWHGLRTIGFCEIDPWCRRVLAKNFPGVPQHDDVTTLAGRTVREWVAGALDDADLPRRGRSKLHAQADPRTGTRGSGLDLLTAGYPCQPFSLAGKRLGAEDDRHLWPHIAALVADLRPAWCLFENVAGHVTLGIDRVLADLEEIGYACWPVVVPACAVGAPHRRDRVWIIARSVADAERVRGREHRAADAAQGALPAALWGEGAPWAGSGGAPLAHAADGGVRRGEPSGQPGQPARGGETLAHAPCLGEREPADETDALATGWAARALPGGGSRRETEPGLGGAIDGLSRQLARPWDGGWEDGVPRVTAGCPDRVNKLKALGNAIVPQVAYVLMGAMFAPEAVALRDAA